MNKIEAVNKIIDVVNSKVYMLRLARNTHFDFSEDFMDELQFRISDESLEKLDLYEFDSGSFYLGKTNGNKREGFGFQYYNDGTFYMGNWYNNDYQGEGYYIKKSYCYHGNFENGDFHGNGTIIGDGVFFWAEFRNGDIRYLKGANTSFTFNGKSYSKTD